MLKTEMKKKKNIDFMERFLNQCNLSVSFDMKNRERKKKEKNILYGGIE